MKTALLICSLSAALFSAASGITIDTVTVGDPGNPNDPSTGGLYGGVNYAYAIGKYEVTLNQYTAFLNAVATTDTYGLYNTRMGTDLNIAGIARANSPGSYAYSVIGSGNRPVTLVNWYDAARFTNWLHNGQPVGLQAAGTTETGAYTLHGSAMGGLETKNADAKYWLPSWSEWHKAAYYQPATAGGDADGYWLYATGSNATPNSRNGSASDGDSANFYRDDAIANGFNGGYAVTNSTSYGTSQNYLTDVGAFTQADSYYGTFDQAGNAGEWIDTILNVDRVLLGGTWVNIADDLTASSYARGTASAEDGQFGFRIATIPEPSAAALVLGVGLALLPSRRRAAY